MHSLKILYLRKNNTYDGLLKEATKLINKKTEITYGEISQFENYLIPEESIDCQTFDILIIYGKDKREILDFAGQLPALSIVRLYDGKSMEKEPVWMGNKFFEEYPVCFFRESIICLSRLIIRNSVFLKELHKCRALSNAVAKMIPNGAVFFNSSGGISTVLHDLSEMEITLKEVQKKNEEMEYLINVVSHDLRSPLHSIDNYISLIREAMGNKLQDEKVLEMFERIHVNVTNMEAMIRDLMEFSRAGITSKDEMSIDLNSVIKEIVHNIQWQVGRKNFIVKTEKLPIVRINPGRIHQVFENLLTNVHKFCIEGEPAEAEIRVKRHNDIIQFSIKDYGIGIDSEHHDKIFNLFYRTKEKIIDGSGAGLAITRKIIRSYGGDIRFESEKDKGTTFYFTLPASRVIKE